MSEIVDSAPPRARIARDLTWVELVWVEKRIERWIRFGRVAEEQLLDRRRRLVGFAPGAVFGFVRWAANDVGTVTSRLDIVRALEPGRACSTLPGVSPGGELLLRLSGWPKVRQVLEIVDGVEALGLDGADVAPDYWRHVHNRLTAKQAPRDYSLGRHRAFQLQQAIGA